MFKTSVIAAVAAVFPLASQAHTQCEEALLKDSVVDSRNFASDFLIAKYEKEVKFTGRKQPLTHLYSQRVGLDNDQIAAQEMERRFGLRISPREAITYVRHSLSEKSADAYSDCQNSLATGFNVVAGYSTNEAVTIKAIWRPEPHSDTARHPIEISDMSNSDLMSPLSQDIAPRTPLKFRFKRLNRDRDMVMAVSFREGPVKVISVPPSYKYTSSEITNWKTASKRAFARYGLDASQIECIPADDGFFFDLSAEPKIEFPVNKDFGGSAIHPLQGAKITSKDRYEICFTVTAHPATKQGSEIEAQVSVKQFRLAIEKAKS